MDGAIRKFRENKFIFGLGPIRTPYWCSMTRKPVTR